MQTYILAVGQTDRQTDGTKLARKEQALFYIDSSTKRQTDRKSGRKRAGKKAGRDGQTDRQTDRDRAKERGWKRRSDSRR